MLIVKQVGADMPDLGCHDVDKRSSGGNPSMKRKLDIYNQGNIILLF